MSFRTASQRFATQCAILRAATFGGALVDGTADADGYNLQIGERKFNAAFTRNETTHEMELHGMRIQVGGAVALIRRSLDLTFTIGTVVTHISSTDTFEVQAMSLDPLDTEDKVALRRRE